MRKPRAEQTAALTQFLKDYPDFRQKELAILSLAMSYQNVDEKRAAVRRFLDEFPASRLKDLAAFQLTLTAPTDAERQAAQDAFVKAYPKSPYARTIYLTRLIACRAGLSPERWRTGP